MEAYSRRSNDRTWRIVEAVRSIAEGRGVSMAEVSLAWLNNRPGVVSTILGARTTQQLETNLRAAGLELSGEERGLLDRVSSLAVGDYPYGELGVAQRSRDLRQ